MSRRILPDIDVQLVIFTSTVVPELLLKCMKKPEPVKRIRVELRKQVLDTGMHILWALCDHLVPAVCRALFEH